MALFSAPEKEVGLMLDKLSLAGLVPVIKVEDARDAVPLCAALKRGGLPVAEITFRTPAAEEAIRLVHEALPDVLLGAGTVLNTAQADAAWKAGAGYLVTPGMNPEVLRHALEKGYPILPGCSSPSDIEAALEMGIRMVKFFPAEALGGLDAVKALAGPYGDMRFVPTGGVNEKNVAAYLRHPKVAACGGSWMVPQDAIEKKDWARIQSLAAEAVQLMLGFNLAHIGINCRDAGEAAHTAGLLAELLGWPAREGANSLFAGEGIELMKQQGYGAKGHVGIGCHHILRAKWHLERRGVRFNEASAKKGPDGRLRLIYLADDIAGFAFHLIEA